MWGLCQITREPQIKSHRDGRTQTHRPKHRRGQGRSRPPHRQACALQKPKRMCMQNPAHGCSQSLYWSRPNTGNNPNPRRGVNRPATGSNTESPRTGSKRAHTAEISSNPTVLEIITLSETQDPNEVHSVGFLDVKSLKMQTYLLRQKTD